MRDRGAKCRRRFYRVSTFDLNVAIRNVACLITINHCPVIIAKQAYSYDIKHAFAIFCFVLFFFLFLFVLSWPFRFRLFVFVLLRTEELEVSPCPLRNVILIEKVAQILTIGLALGIKTIIITQLLHLIRNKKERKGEGRGKFNWSRKTSRDMNLWKVKLKNRRIGNKDIITFLIIFLHIRSIISIFEGKKGKKLLFLLDSFFRLKVDIMKFN